MSDIQKLISGTKEEQLEVIEGMTRQRLKNLLHGDIPEELEYIVTEVTVARFNRVGSEGTDSHTVAGESMSWSDRDFDAYADEIQAWLDAQEDEVSGRGQVVFI